MAQTGGRTLILIRHGQSTWNLENRFTGWFDADLTEQGEAEAVAGGEVLLAEGLPPDVLPAAECLQDVVARMLPWWEDGICADLAAGRQVLVAAHGNSLRALVKHLDGIGDDDIAELNIPTGVPLVYELGDDFRPLEAKPVEDRYLGDLEAIKAAADAVAKQAG